MSHSANNLQEAAVYTASELAFLDALRIPSHIAIIMDGNRRWAKGRGLPHILGHWEGAETLTRIVRAASVLGVKVLTVYSFSTENWGRSKEEVEALMALIESYLVKQSRFMLQEGVKLDAIGALSALPKGLLQTLQETKELTAHCDRIELILALNYGGRDDIRRATQAIVQECMEGKLNKDEITEELFSCHLDTAKWKDPELLIRTSGEQRLSNFLLWQLSYSEVYISDVFWPDFTKNHLLEAILSYQKRERRGGRS